MASSPRPMPTNIHIIMLLPFAVLLLSARSEHLSNITRIVPLCILGSRGFEECNPVRGGIIAFYCAIVQACRLLLHSMEASQARIVTLAWSIEYLGLAITLPRLLSFIGWCRRVPAFK